MLTATDGPSARLRATPTQAMPASFSSTSCDQPRRRVCSMISCNRGRGSEGPTASAYGASRLSATPSAASSARPRERSEERRVGKEGRSEGPAEREKPDKEKAGRGHVQEDTAE